MSQDEHSNTDPYESFDSKVRISDINPYVDVPDRVVATLGGNRKMPVLIKIANPKGELKNSILEKDAKRLKAIARLAPGNWFRTTLVPLRSERTRLYLDKWMRATSDVKVGNIIKVIVKPDHGPRTLEMPLALSDALAETIEPKLRGKLSPLHANVKF